MVVRALVAVLVLAAVAFVDAPRPPPWRTEPGAEPPPRVVIVNVDQSAY